MINTQTVDYFQIRLAGFSQIFVIPLEYILEVLTKNPEQICPIPGVNPEVLGVINYRGKLLWIVNISRVLQPSLIVEISKKNKQVTILVIQFQEINLGFLITELQGITSLDEQQFQPMISFNKNYITSQAQVESKIISLLNIDAILSHLHQSLPS